MRRIQHPGAAAEPGVHAVATGTRRLDLTLEAAGQSLLDAIGAALMPLGVRSAVLSLHGGMLFPLAYAMPALSKTTEHAVYFSDSMDAPAPAALEVASVTYGERDGQPWLHCHAVWTHADGTRCCGHLLPDQTLIAEPLRAGVCLLDDAQFQVQQDDETRFALFKPVAADKPRPPFSAPTSWALRVAPNVDLCRALEAHCREHGITHADICGGVGSLVGAVFDDGQVVQPFVTEVLIRHGRVRPDAGGAPLAEVDVSLIDYTGAIAQGRLARDANPVLVTFELVVVPTTPAQARP